MTVRDLAEQVLFGATMADKLVDLSGAVDERRGAGIDAPDAPGRPAGLAVGGGSTRARIPFPKLSELDRAERRGHVFHFFANHELLALELMALALLKFPDAPDAFRSGIVRTMSDEQRHMQLYVDYMNRWGVALGDIGVNDYFWRCCADMQTPLDYVTRMSMTLEQANLDYCLHYAGAFRTVGDAGAAAALDEVCADEVRHVAHGITWFDRLRPAGEDQFDAFARLLAPPLTVTRGRGIGFNEQARRGAGFDARFIDEMRVLSRPSGRPPAVYAMDPADDHALLPAVLASGDDVVIVDRRPPLAILTGLQRLGVTLPAVVAIGGARPIPRASIDAPALGALRPWRRDAATVALFGALDDGATLATDPVETAARPPRLVCTVSVSLTVRPDGSHVEHGVVRAYVDDDGEPVAWLLARATTGMPGPLARFCHGDGGGKSRLVAMLESAARGAAAAEAARGYVGPLTVDVAITDDGGLAMAPAPRPRRGLTVERVAAALTRLVGPSRIGVLLSLTAGDARDAGYADVAAFAHAAGSDLILVTDPTGADSALAVAVGDDLERCADLIDARAARFVRRQSARRR